MRQFLPAHLYLSTSSSTGKKRKKKNSIGAEAKPIETLVVESYQVSWDKCFGAAQRRKMSAVETSAIAASLGQEEEEKMWSDIELQLKLLYLQQCWCKPYYG